MKYTQIQLGSMIGTWKYSAPNLVKYYRVTPVNDTFVINWGRSESELNDPKTMNKIIIKDSEECYKRILSKVRGGYVLDKALGTLTPKCFDEFDCIGEVLLSEHNETRKRKPRKRKLSLLDWMSGVEENRENEKE